MVYVVEFKGTGNQVAMFEILPSPTANTGSASNVAGTSATLNGTVNPNGVISQDCQLEYTDDADFQVNAWANAESVACSPQPFNESTDVSVSASVTNLSPGTTYDYRVVETTQAGTAEGNPVQFTTLAPPTATTGGATGVSQHAATLAGSVNPHGEATTSCRIEWGPAAGNYSTGQAPCSPEPGSSAADTAVSAAATGLAANTTYHFRVVEATAGGTVSGNDATFVTLADTCQTNPAVCPSSGGGGSTGGGGGTTTEDKAAYGKCVAAANKTFKKALKKAKSKHGKARATAIKAAKKKKGKLVNSCKSRFL
jgi:phosphodiesterase/alkaline phosphatase D-like protein